MDRSESKMSSAAKMAGKAGLAGAVLGLGAAVKVGFGEFMEAQKVSAQTAAVLKSTGGAANVTSKSIGRLSESLMKKSGVDDEAIQSGANMLLTFTKIRNEAGKGNQVFDAATKVTLNLSVAMGKDMQSSAVLVGKALNDPIKGIGALSRVGVQLDESQKKLIKSLVASGNTMGAQKIILGELETQFGGSAEAAGKTFAGQVNIAKESLTNLAGEGVAKLMPKLMEFASWVTEKGLPKLKNFAAGLTGNESVKAAFGALSAFWRDSFKPALKAVGDAFGDVLAAVKRLLDNKQKEFKLIFDGIAGAAKVVSTVFTEVVIPALKFVFRKGGPFDIAFGLAIEIVAGTVKAIGGIVDGVKGAVNAVKRFWDGDGGKVFKKVFDAIELAVKPTVTAFTKIVDAVEWLIANIEKIPKPPSWLGKSGIDIIRDIGSETGKVSAVGGVTNKLWDEIALGRGMGLTLSSGLRPGDPGDHGRGHAIDMSGPASAMATFAMAAMNRSGIKDVIYGGLPFWMDNGRRVSTWAGNEALRADHYGHAHVSVFDKGGWLAPNSATLAINRTPYWEQVGPPQRESGRPIVLQVNLDSREIARTIYDPLRTEKTRQERLGREW